ncbi:MAG TPA: NAD(P)/FAD-dependent oxidoreductase [Thermomicrobiales bacterium]|nr:NAD(P)/FAD-dependent oxidoreductase [Thermomicrobiales bacterium]
MAANGVERSRNRILILGGGFAGVYTARALQHELRGTDAKVAIVNRENFHVFYPMLPEIISGAIDTEQVLNPIRRVAPQARLYVGDVTGIDLANQRVEIRHGLYQHRQTPRTLYYDHVVLALGGVPSVSRIPGLAEYAFDVQRLSNAFALRNHVIDTLEQAAIERDPAARERLLTYVVIGGGPTGVEIAAEINSLVDEAVQFYAGIERSDLRVIIVEYAPRILGPMPENLAAFAAQALEERGIELLVNTGVERIERHLVVLNNGESIHAETVVGSVGVDINPLIRDLDAPHDERGRLVAHDTLRVGDYPNVWAVGDNARVMDPTTGKPYPQTGQHAVRQAKRVAGNIAAAIKGEPLKPMNYKTRGKMVALGRRNAIAEVFGKHFSGFPAWFIWRSYYLTQMPLFDKRVRVVFSWTIDLLAPPTLVQLKVGQPAPMADVGDR